MLLKHSGFSHPNLLADKAGTLHRGPGPSHRSIGVWEHPSLCHTDGPANQTSHPRDLSVGVLPVSLTRGILTTSTQVTNIYNHTAIPGETSPRVTNSEHSHRIYPVRMRVPQKGPQPKFTERRPLEMALPVAQGHCH